MRVMKFGGAAMADASMMRNVASIVSREQGPRFLVASAMAGVTDAITRALGPITQDEAQAHVLMSELRARHHVAVQGISDTKIQSDTLYLVNKGMDTLERLLFGIAYTEELTARSHDLALSFGERLSVRILSGYLREAGLESEPLDADRIGVVTHGPFGYASPDLEATAERLKKSLLPKVEEGVPIVTGYFGADHENHTTLFGRGGSDFSAAIMANAVDAEVLEVWKESQGFMTADPRVVKTARTIPEMSYEEAAELAAFGAKILHPRTVEPVASKRIPIHVREIHNPEAPGTRIQSYETAPDGYIRSVAGRDGLTIVKLLGPGMGFTPGVAADVFDLMRAHQLNVINMAASEASFALLMDGVEARQAVGPLAATTGGVIQEVVTEESMSLVAVVGKDLGKRVGSAAQILQAVSDAGVNVQMISLGASDIAINFVVREAQGEDALKAVHKAFLEEAS